MRSTFALTLAAALAMLATDSNAGPGSGSSGGSRASSSASTSTRSAASIGAGAGSRASSAPSLRGATSAGAGAGMRSAARPAAARPYGQLGTRAASTARRSLLGAGPQPSSRLTQIIRERERSGPGWIGTAVLIALLSQHDLSASDRSWIQDKIDALKGEEGGSAAAALLPAVSRSFTVTGASQLLHIGRAASIDIATSVPAAELACQIEGAATQPVVSHSASAANITWTPDRAGAYILNCRAGKHIERRVLRVAAN